MKVSKKATALFIAALLMLLSAGSVALYVTMGREDDPVAAANTVWFLAAPLIMAGFGAVLAFRLPNNIIAWLFIGAAAGIDLEVVPQAYAFAAYAADPRLPLASAAVVMQGIFWPAHLPFTVLLFILFPNGRPLSRRWAVAGGVAVIAPIALMIISLFVPEAVGPYHDVTMPLALKGEAAALFDAVTGPIIGLLFLGPLVIGCAALIVRFRRSRGIERAQMKWLTVGAVVIIVTQLVSLAGPLGMWGPLLSGVAFALLPLSIAVAVLRYRLYEIDVLIRRTLVYAAVSAVLLAAYVGAVAVFQRILAPMTEGNGVAVALSTLAVVALFQPVRRRIGGAVDRRFYRSRYDAERTLEAFSTRLRDEVDLRSLETELLGAVNETVQPSRASVWLR